MLFLADFWNSLNVAEFHFPSITTIDILDIAIVTFLIYNLTVWIKETRAWALFKGILVVLVFSIIAIVLRLNTILWILSNTLSVALISIIVIFQPELRKALEQLGKGGFISSFTFSDTYESEQISHGDFDKITKAVAEMSGKKTGALMLIEREVPLGDFESSGVKMDAIITGRLIKNIFDKHTPLHDGAMIIRRSRIAAASCILPLSDSKLSTELGTRHRAAVGASESSDAFVIVVSEETGDISVASGGRLNRKLKPEDLKHMFFGRSKSKKRKLWKGNNR
jgi:diadenylate cyclase